MSSLAFSAAKAAAGPDRVQICDATGNVLVLFHASLKESYETTVTPTQFPVEGGAVITDHLIAGPFKFTFTGIISDTPIGTDAALLTEAAASAASALLPPLGVAAAGAAYGLMQADADDSRPSRAMYEKMVRLQLGIPDPDPKAPKPAGRLLTVKSRLGTWRSLVISSLTAPRSAEYSGAIAFDITFEQVRIVRPQTVDVAKFQNAGLAADVVNIGDQSPLTSKAAEGHIAARSDVGESVVGGGG